MFSTFSIIYHYQKAYISRDSSFCFCTDLCFLTGIFSVTKWFWYAEKGCPILENDETSNRGTLRSVTTVVCSYLLQMGDDFLVFQMLETVIVDQIVS